MNHIKKRIEERVRVASETVESILRGDPVTNDSLVILAGEAKVAFAGYTVGWDYLGALAIDEETDKNRLLARSPLVELPPDIALLLKTMKKDQVIAFLGLQELVQIRTRAEAMGYWRMPN
jgi:hypothetical protein